MSLPTGWTNAGTINCSNSGIGHVPYTNTAAVLNNYVYVIGAGHDHELDVSGASITWNSEGSFNLGSFKTEALYLSSANKTAYFQSRCASVIAGATPSLYLFWQACKSHGSDVQGLAAVPLSSSQLDPSNQPSTQKPWVLLQDSTGTPFPSNVNADVAATTLDDDHIFVAFINSSGSDLYVGLFQPSTIDPSTSTNPGSWKATLDWTFSLSQLQGAASGLSGLKSLGQNLSMDWFSVNGSQLVNHVQFWMYFAVWGGEKNQNAYVFSMPFDPISMPLVMMGGIAQFPTLQVSSCQSFPATNPATVQRDPAGRIRCYWTYSDSGQQYLAAFSQPAVSAPAAVQPVSAYNLAATPNPSEITTAPIVAFLTSTKAIGATVVNDPDFGGTTTLPASPVYEMLFVSDQTAMVLASRNYGMLQQSLNRAGPSTTLPVVVAGIFDSPLPCPDINTLGNKPLQPSNGKVTYGMNTQSGTSRSVSMSLTVGFTFTGDSTKGLGPSWDLSLSAGAGLQATSTTSKETVQNIYGSADLDPTGQYTLPYGVLAANQAQINFNLFRFLVPESPGTTSYIVAPDAARSTQMAGTLTNQTFIQFVPWTVIPGDLASYTREAWNARMAQLGYPGTNYFEDVIVANAFQFNGQPCLQYSAAVCAGEDHSFQQAVGTALETTWTLSETIEGGISGGEGIEVFGFGENEEFNFLAGFTYTCQLTEEASSQNTWGISIDAFQFTDPPTTNPPGIGVTEYNFNLYFLPASKRWMDEFFQYRTDPATATTLPNPGLTAPVDPNSKPWRIVFEVTGYTLQNGTQYPSNLQTPTPPPPTIVTWVHNMPGGGNGIWQPETQVMYGLQFVSGSVPSEITWSPETSFSSGEGGYMCAELTVPVDSTGWATSRVIWRQFSNGNPIAVGTILDDTTTVWSDDNPAFNWPAPPAVGSPANAGWTARSNYPNSIVWVPYNQVQYAVTFVINGLESELSDWGQTIEINYWACPTLQNVPTFQDYDVWVCTARNIYRQCYAPDGQTLLQSPTLVGTIPDNVTTTFADTTP